MDKYWTAGLRSGNFVIASYYMTTNRSGIHVQSDVAIQINQDGFIKLPNDIEFEGSSIFESNIDIKNLAH